MKKVLTIAGSDSCGGAGIQADLKTFSAHLVYGMSVITSVTAQNTQGVTDAYDLPVEVIEKQISAIFDDIKVDAVKIGMLSSSEIISIVANSLKLHKAQNIVLDPVMISKSGFNLLKEDAVKTLINELIPICTIITPNIYEASLIVQMDIKDLEDMKIACKKIYDKGARYVLVKGGHLNDDAIDVLFDGQDYYQFKGSRIKTKNTHGTGCTLSSAIASNLALGFDIVESIRRSKNYIQNAIENSFSIGMGVGPVDHFYAFRGLEVNKYER
ncbi:bifunctional hydroxymethylpyrimidine kinase/phosphomethylpyrimidine kinase [Thermobrachium celere]|uniref:bifunctional hydroxymethylpyrimidine kinase/phosphomethylpyrimidine kinase n=1 Tax=Thermobrachium celere TaxID=53422 RepID=UPI0019459B18|nr:bifunctional hydroxymethylpyrimidine kinase/phosphomethylpyrimidine kinase [Thermobrachium celere]GFR34222.1 bifunctional hydroxymethylpyrimidine kinase/phosphomethylpyrimidine kinase [Thermobrachium celere]